MIKSIMILGLTLLATACTHDQYDGSQEVNIFSAACKHGLFYGPHKKFAVYVFCDDALGTTIGIINTQPGGTSNRECIVYFDLHERFWQDKDWALDVLSVKWSEDGLFLTVDTDYIYGSDKHFVLDLVHRKVVSAVSRESTSPEAIARNLAEEAKMACSQK